MTQMSTAAGNIVTSDKVVDVKVKNKAAEKLGEINSLVLDKKSDEKEIFVPWNVLSYGVSERCFILDTHKDKLTHMKGIDRDFSDWSNRNWGREVYREYGTKPY